jgi:hypothetical protein
MHDIWWSDVIILTYFYYYFGIGYNGLGQTKDLLNTSMLITVTMPVQKQPITLRQDYNQIHI